MRSGRLALFLVALGLLAAAQGGCRKGGATHPAAATRAPCPCEAAGASHAAAPGDHAPCPCGQHGMHGNTGGGPGPCPCMANHADGGHAGHDHAALPGTPAVTGRSVYQLDSRWQNQRGEDVPLALYRGHPTVVLMFYGTCRAVCPLLITDVKRIEEALAPAVRENTRFLLVSFDPDVDTPARLAELARERELDAARWTLLHGAADDVRALATVLGVQYRSTGDGQYAHSNIITLLDGEGAVAFQLEGVRQPVDAMVQHINTAAAAHPGS